MARSVTTVMVVALFSIWLLVDVAQWTAMLRLPLAGVLAKPAARKCSQECLLSHECNRGTIDTTAECGDHLSCCSRLVRKCPHQCVGLDLRHLCDPQKTDLGSTDCSKQETCCQMKNGTSKREERAVTPLPTKCQHSCLSGVPAEFCLSLEVVMPGTCPTGYVCCHWVDDEADDADDTFEFSSEEVRTTTVRIIPTTTSPPAKGTAPAGMHSTTKTMVTTVAPSTTAIQPQFNCEGYGRCLAPYLSAECRGRSGDSEFSPLFICPSNPKFRCCVKKTVLAKLASQSDGSKDRPVPSRTIISGSSCGQTGRDLSPGSKGSPKWCWVVELVDTKDELLCYGVLVELQFISTVASCFPEPAPDVKNVFVKFPWKSEKYAITRRIPHFAFAAETMNADIALIRLKLPVDLQTTGACLICLPPDPDFRVENTTILVPPGDALQDDSGQRRGNVAEFSAPLAAPEACLTDETLGFAQLPVNAVCVFSDGSASPSKGTPLIAKNADGFYILSGHLSFSTSSSSTTSLYMSVFSNAASKCYLDFIKAGLSVWNSLEPSGTAESSPDRTGGTEATAEIRSSDSDDGTFCRALAPIQHGSFRIVGCDTLLVGLSTGHSALNRTDCLVDNTKYLPGTRVKYQCEKYYQVVGQEWRKCGKTGEWSSPQPPYCEPVCGRRISTTSLSTKGTKSVPGEWPWVAGIYDTAEKVLSCGGALMKESWVLTAAHCVTTRADVPQQPEDFKVYLGKIYRSSDKDDEYVQEFEVGAVIPHPSFSRSNMDSDVALLRLKTPATLTYRVQLVCLPQRQDLSDINREPGSIGTVAGWGSTHEERLASQLQHIRLPVVSAKVCRDETITTSGDSGAARVLNNNKFCAGYGMKDPPEEFRTVCPGDSGGPLVFQQRGSNDDSWIAEGIVSFYMNSNLECGERGPGMYAVFTSVFAYMDWIEANAV